MTKAHKARLTLEGVRIGKFPKFCDETMTGTEKLAVR